jgi:CHASE2 domain-containing sensor protein
LHSAAALSPGIAFPLELDNGRVLPRVSPMRIAKRFKRARLNGLAILAFAVLATAAAVVARHAPVTSILVGRLDQVIYDSLYQLRPPQDMTGSEVVLVAVDQPALDAVDKDLHEGWPWPLLSSLSACRRWRRALAGSSRTIC